jgi:hypothetical protein
MLSKNSASSRAIPHKRMLESVKNNPFIPIRWMKDHSGMQGNEYWENPHDIQNRIDAWLAARDSAVTHSQILNESLGVTKQLTNRGLEAYMWHTVILTGTEFENFFSLRCSEFADIHIQKLAYEMLEAYNASTPNFLNEGEWHIPFGDKIDSTLLFETLLKINNPSTYEQWKKGFADVRIPKERLDEAKIKIAIARCARVSYTVVGEEGKPDNYENDIKLHDRLATSGHYSPFEHVGRAMTDYEFAFDSSFNADDGEEGTWGWSGNFRGFIQYRKTLANENRKDDRVVQK